MKHRKRYFEITFPGLVFVAVSLFVLLAAVNSQTNLLFFAFGLMFGAVLVSALLGAVMLRRIEITRITADHAAAGAPAEIHYRVSNLKRTWPSFAMRVADVRFSGAMLRSPDAYCLHLAPGASTTLMTHFVPAGRGRLEFSEIRVACSFPFGFINRAVHFIKPQSVVVYPRVGELTRGIAMRCRESLSGGALTANVRGGQDEFYGLREYRPGDNIRTIHWRRTARTGELMVREMTATAPPQLIVALDLRGRETVPDFAAQAERAIELAASVVCYGFLENYAIGLYVPGLQMPDLVEPRMGRDNRARLLEALALIDVGALNVGAPAPPALRDKRRAHWVIVSLSPSTSLCDIIPSQTPATILSMDNPESKTWVKYQDVPKVADFSSSKEQ